MSPRIPLKVQWATANPAAVITDELLTEDQARGHACVRCGRRSPVMAPVGWLQADGGQVFACHPGCSL